MRSYQRGVLLGLTLAEVFILLLFVFLLILSNNQKDTGSSKKDDSQGNPSPENNTLGISLSDVTWGSNKTFLPPITPRDLVQNGAPESPPPPLGLPPVKSTESGSMLIDEQEPTTEVRSDKSNFFSSNSLVSDKGKQKDKQDGIKSNDSEINPPIKDGHNWPPIITITEAEGYSFPTGSAYISNTFKELLTNKVAALLKENIDKYQANIVEVFGHTDEQPKSGYSNLDVTLINAVNGRFPIDKLSAADNVGLGMARAVSVVKVLSLCPELSNIKILPYSAGQSVDNTGSLSTGLSGDRPSRRRIEIRLRGI